MKNIDTLRRIAGVLTDCNAEENNRYNEMLKRGDELPQNIICLEDAEGKPYVNSQGNHVFNKLSDSKERQELILLRIYDNLHFIWIIFQIAVSLAIILGIIMLFTLL